METISKVNSTEKIESVCPHNNAEQNQATTLRILYAVQSISKQKSISIEMKNLLDSYISRAMDAYRNRCLFYIYDKYYAVKALQRRGWLQKNLPCRHAKLKTLRISELLSKAEPGNEYEAALLSDILNKFPVNFVWMPIKCITDIDNLAYRNRTDRGNLLDFSTKVGLIGCTEQEHWYKQEGVCEMSYPRCYRMGGKFEEHIAFTDDFRRTQCRNLAQFIVNNIDKPHKIIDEKSGKVYLADVKFALDNLRLQLDDFDDISFENDNTYINAQKWDSFIEHSTLVINKKAKFNATLSKMTEYMGTALTLLRKLEIKRPDYKWDGLKNLWILKPACGKRGVGIKVIHSLKDILEFAGKNKNQEYIAQKYVERPLLIYKTKFDIRLYVLLTYNDSLLRIWIYKNCLLRFSTQTFSLEALNSSVHLTNRSVQKMYKNYMQDPRIPKELMWSLEDFKEYLKHHDNLPFIWDEKIFPALSRNVVSVILSSLEEMEFVENTFDFVGYDFMLDKHYNPILIEVNASPDLSTATSVKKRISPMVQEDLIKVLVDLPNNPSASTGNWDKVYELEYADKLNFKPNLEISCQSLQPR